MVSDEKRGYRVKSDGARDTARASKPGSMLTSPISPDIHSGTSRAQPYFNRKEHGKQGGGQYLRCRDCRREVISDFCEEGPREHQQRWI